MAAKLGIPSGANVLAKYQLNASAPNPNPRNACTDQSFQQWLPRLRRERDHGGLALSVAPRRCDRVAGELAYDRLDVVDAAAPQATRHRLQA